MMQILKDNNIIATLEKDDKKFILNYQNNLELKDSISLSLPANKKYYIFDSFPPFFETFLPEGYLYEIFKNIIMKEYGTIDDFLLFSFLAANIDGRIKFQTDLSKIDFPHFDIEEVLTNDDDDLFNKILHTFLNKNAISGVQPKTIAFLKDSIQTKEYILKTWGSEFPHLSENEFFCLKALNYAGVKTVNYSLSRNKKFLLVEKFNYDKNRDEFLGFEEVLSLMNKNRIQKYSGSYEQVAKIVYGYSTDKLESMKEFYTITVMNFLLKNGDAHLKNFGLLYDNNIKNIIISPAYDVINTVVYLYKDIPALTLNGQKIWHGKDKLIEFGIKNCFLNKEQVLKIWDNCFEALKEIIKEIKGYINVNNDFKNIGERMIDIFEISLSGEKFKEIPNEITRSWNTDKKNQKR
jgi:serine/threonine-protein kinase HipA